MRRKHDRYYLAVYICAYAEPAPGLVLVEGGSTGDEYKITIVIPPSSSEYL